MRKVELETGSILQIEPLDPRFFGEGITILDGQIVQLTLDSGVGFVYDTDSFSLLRQFDFVGPGWGITYDGHRLILSDGSETLRFLDPETFAEIGKLEVTQGDHSVGGINELEYVRGEIYANIWLTDLIARISPETGDVTGWIDLRGILSRQDRAEDTNVLNGIAYDIKGDRLFVTGKRWPKLFEIELLARSN